MDQLKFAYRVFKMFNDANKRHDVELFTQIEFRQGDIVNLVPRGSLSIGPVRKLDSLGIKVLRGGV